MRILILLLLVILSGCVTPIEVDTEDVKKYEEGRDFYSKKQYNDAVSAFKVVVDEYPWSSKVDNSLEYWGKSILKIGEDTDDVTLYDSAFSLFMQIPERSSGFVEAQYYAGTALHSIYDNDGSVPRDSLVGHLYNVYEKWPKNGYATKSILLIVETFLEDGVEDSAKYYANIIGLSLGDSLSVIDKANYSRARSLYIAATKTDLQADYDMAIDSLKAYQESGKSDSLKTMAAFYIGKSYYRSGRYSESIQWFDEVLDDNDVSRETLDESLYRKGYAFSAIDSSESAIKAFEEYDEQYSDGVYIQYAWRYLGDLSLDKIDTSSAIRWYRKVIDMDSVGTPNEASLYVLGGLYYAQDSFGEVITMLIKYLERYSNESDRYAANAYRLLGHSYRKSNDLTQSLKWFEDGVKLDRFKATTYYDNLLYWSGSVAYDLDDTAKAKEYLEQYVQKYPSGSYITSANTTLEKINGGY